MDYIIFIIAMSALIYGANFIIIESERIALHFNISHFVIGATLIAIGTSLPEMAASISASAQDKSEMAVSNVLGSVTFNISLVLGLIFLIAKKVNPVRDLFRKDSAWSLFPFGVFIIMAYDGTISRFEGIVFLIMMGAYLLFLSSDAKNLEEEIDTSLAKKFAWPKTLILLSIGFVLVIGGANFTIDSASAIARDLGVSEWIIGLLLIAFGTSLPELVVSVVAAKKGNADMIIGNIIGSNVANFTVVLGSAALVHPLRVDISQYGFDVLCAGVATLMLVFLTANRLYDKSAGLGLLTVIALMISHSLKEFF